MNGDRTFDHTTCFVSQQQLSAAVLLRACKKFTDLNITHGQPDACKCICSSLLRLIRPLQWRGHMGGRLCTMDLDNLVVSRTASNTAGTSSGRKFPSLKLSCMSPTAATPRRTISEKTYQSP